MGNTHSYIQYILRRGKILYRGNRRAWWVCFSLNTMASFHCHRCLLLFFVVFLCFLIAHECEHLLGSLITWEVLCWAIILLLYIIIVFLRAQSHRFDITVVDCYILIFFLWLLPTDECDHLLVSLLTLGVIFWVIALSLYIIIVFLPAQWHHFTTTIVDYYIFIFLWYPPMDDCNH